MNISSVSSTPPRGAPTTPPPAPASDGDTPAQEAAESAAVKQAEKNNGGFEPKATQSVSSTGGIDRIV